MLSCWSTLAAKWGMFFSLGNHHLKLPCVIIIRADNNWKRKTILFPFITQSLLTCKPQRKQANPIRFILLCWCCMCYFEYKDGFFESWYPPWRDMLAFLRIWSCALWAVCHVHVHGQIRGDLMLSSIVVHNSIGVVVFSSCSPSLSSPYRKIIISDALVTISPPTTATWTISLHVHDLVIFKLSLHGL